MSEVLENEYVVMSKNDDVLFVDYKPAAEITIEAARKVVEDRVKLTKGVPHYVMADVSNIKSSSKEAREYLSQLEGGLVGIKAGAFISGSVFSYAILNLYLKINKPVVPARFFANRQTAMEWIDELKAKELSEEKT